MYVRFYIHFDATIRFGPFLKVFWNSSVWATLFDLQPPPKGVVFVWVFISLRVHVCTFCLVNIERIRVYTQNLAAETIVFRIDFSQLCNCYVCMGVCVENLDIYRVFSGNPRYLPCFSGNHRYLHRFPGNPRYLPCFSGNPRYLL